MGVFVRGRKLWITYKAADGKWKNAPTGYDVGQEELARATYETVVRGVRSASPAAPAGPVTVRQYAAAWLLERERMDLDWKADRGRLNHHILPVIGDMPIADVRTRHIIEMVRHVRTTPREATGEPVAQRTVYNVYSVASALFRDAKLADLIAQTPCELDARQLGPLKDKDPEWRAEAVFSRAEVETILSHPAIPVDRQVLYALELLAGVRPGEAAALRWRHYDAAMEPLGKLLVALAYNTRKHRQKSTKTDAVKHVPVHPTLAAMLGAWKLGGWPAMMGRTPEPDDLIVPLPPSAAARRRTREGDAYRGHDYSGKRWRDADLPALGWRHRRHYDMRATFITLALEDGADPHIIETRVTHTKKSRSAFDGYNRGQQWAITCAEVAKLRIARRGDRDVIAMPLAAVAEGGNPSAPYSELTIAATIENQPRKKWKRRESNERLPSLSVVRCEQSREVEPASTHAEARAVVPAVTTSLQLVADPIEVALTAATRAWIAERDHAALRAELQRLVGEIDDLDREYARRGSRNVSDPQ